jgi:hypothetical protein
VRPDGEAGASEDCSDGRFARPLLLKQAQARRKTFLNEISKLEQALNSSEKKLLQCELEIAALEYVPETG